MDGYLFLGQAAGTVPPRGEPIPVDLSAEFAVVDRYEDVVFLGPVGSPFAVDASRKDRLALKELLVESETAESADNDLLASWLGDWPAGAWMFPDREAGQELGQWIDGNGTNSFFKGVFDHDGPGALVLGAGPSAAAQFMFETPSVSVVFRVNNRKRSILHAERFFQRIDANGRMGLLRKDVAHAEARLIAYQATEQGFLQFRDEDRFAYGVTDDVLVIGNSLKVVRQLMARTWPKEGAPLPTWYSDQTQGGRGQRGSLWLDAPPLAKAGQSMVGAMRVANVIEANPEYEAVIDAWERFFGVLEGWQRVEGSRDAGWEITIHAGDR